MRRAARIQMCIRDRDGRGSLADPGGKGKEIRLHKAVIAAGIDRNAGVGIPVVAIARKVLEAAPHMAGVHFLHHGGDILSSLLGRTAKGPAIDVV